MQLTCDSVIRYDKEKYQPFNLYKDQPDCRPMHEWQSYHFSTCNLVHEQPLNDKEGGKYLARGSWRQTFEVYDSGTGDRIALKTLRNTLPFKPNTMERHRVDSVMYERLTSSPYVMDIYGHCGYSGLFEFSDGGTLDGLIRDRQDRGKKPLSRVDKLSLAVEVASGVAAVHTMESRNGYSAMVHSDLHLEQFVWSGGRYKLNDFNRGHLMYWNHRKHESCPYYWPDGNPGPVSLFHHGMSNCMKTQPYLTSHS